MSLNLLQVHPRTGERRAKIPPRMWVCYEALMEDRAYVNNHLEGQFSNLLQFCFLVLAIVLMILDFRFQQRLDWREHSSRVRVEHHCQAEVGGSTPGPEVAGGDDSGSKQKYFFCSNDFLRGGWQRSLARDCA